MLKKKYVKPEEANLLLSARLNSLISGKNEDHLIAEADAYQADGDYPEDALREGVALALRAQWRPIYEILFESSEGDEKLYFIGTEAEVEARIRKIPDATDDDEEEPEAVAYERDDEAF